MIRSPFRGAWGLARITSTVAPACISTACATTGYVSVHPDGSGAKDVPAPNVIRFDGLQPATPLYFFVTTLGADGAESKPSEIREVVLKDEFPFK